MVSKSTGKFELDFGLNQLETFKGELMRRVNRRDLQGDSLEAVN